MAKQQRGLGKGIGALLGVDSDFTPLRQPVGYVNKEVVGQRDVQDTADILRIPVDLIEPNPYQPRMQFPSGSIA